MELYACRNGHRYGESLALWILHPSLALGSVGVARKA
jgi:hypothetical protein